MVPPSALRMFTWAVRPNSLAQSATALKKLLNSRHTEALRAAVWMRRGKPSWPENLVAQADEIGLRGHGRLDGLLDFRVADGKLAHGCKHPDPVCGAAVLPGLEMRGVKGGHHPAAMVDAAGQHEAVRALQMRGRVHTGAAGDKHAHGLGLPLHDGVGGKGGAEVESGHADRVFPGENRGQHLAYGREQVVVIGFGFGPGQEPAPVYQHGVGVRASNIYAKQPWLSILKP